MFTTFDNISVLLIRGSVNVLIKPVLSDVIKQNIHHENKSV